MDASMIYWYLKSHKLFEVLSHEEIKQLQIISNYKQVRKNEILFFSGEESKRMYIVKEGILKICHQDEQGEEIITELLSDHDIFGYLYFSPLYASPPEQYAKALTDEAKICTFEVKHLLRLFQQNPDLMLRYSGYIGEKFVMMQEKYSNLIFKTVRERVLEFFRKYVAHHGKEQPNGSIEVELVLTQQEIADYVAASRQSIVTIIGQLEQEEIIVFKSRKKLIIPKPALLYSLHSSG